MTDDQAQKLCKCASPRDMGFRDTMFAGTCGNCEGRITFMKDKIEIIVDPTLAPNEWELRVRPSSPNVWQTSNPLITFAESRHAKVQKHVADILPDAPEVIYHTTGPLVAKSAYDTLLREFKALDTLRTMDIEQLNALAKRIAELEEHPKKWKFHDTHEYRDELERDFKEQSEESDRLRLIAQDRDAQNLKANQRIKELEGSQISRKLAMAKQREQRLVAFIEHAKMFSQCMATREMADQALKAHNGGA